MEIPGYWPGKRRAESPLQMGGSAFSTHHGLRPFPESSTIFLCSCAQDCFLSLSIPSTPCKQNHNRQVSLLIPLQMTLLTPDCSLQSTPYSSSFSLNLRSILDWFPVVSRLGKSSFDGFLERIRRPDIFTGPAEALPHLWAILSICYSREAQETDHYSCCLCPGNTQCSTSIQKCSEISEWCPSAPLFSEPRVIENSNSDYLGDPWARHLPRSPKTYSSLVLWS